MRPVRLTMQAFGPYPGRIAIDFRDAVDAGLFGIYGQTGSGKSTIFSAMTFALFGAPAKPDQEAPSLRSDHADAGLVTEVEFIFDIGTRRYVIVRRPEQMRPKQRGEGETRSAHEAFLFEASGMAVDEITDTKRGKIIAEKKVGKVDSTISEMLGYGAEQFRQIVLLPQGRFETFLAAKTKERLEILRELFDVSLYRHLATKLKMEADDAERHVRGEREVCARRLKAEGFESTDALTTGISEAETHHARLFEAEKAARTLLEAAAGALRDAEAVDAQFKAADEAAATLGGFEASKAENEALSERVAMAERALTLIDPETNVADAAEDVSKAENALITARDAVADTKAKADAAAEALKKESDRAGEIETLRRQIDKLDDHEQALDKAANAIVSVETAQAVERKALSELKHAQDALRNLENVRNEKTEALKSARQTTSRRHEIGVQLAALETAHTAAKTFETARTAVLNAAAEFEKLNTAHEQALRHVHEMLADYENAERKLSAAQALQLAAKLEDGAPCPVCGSTEHPAPATHSDAHVESDQAFRSAKTQWQRADMAARGTARDLAAAQSVLNDRQDRIAGMEEPANSTAELSAKLQDERLALQSLAPEIDLIQAQSEIDKLGGETEILASKRDVLREAHFRCQTNCSVEQTRLDEMLASVPIPLRDRTVLASTRQTAAQALAVRETAKAAAEKHAADTRERAVAAGKDQEAAERALSVCKTRHTKAVDAFGARLVQAGLSEEGLHALKPAIANIDIDRATVEDFHRKLAIAKDSSEKANEAIREKTRPDLEGLMTKRLETEHELNRAKDELSSARSRLEQLQKLHDDLADTFRMLDEAEAESGPLRNLAALLNGENAQKLDLETFAIGAMFDQVLRAANLRIGPMTNNRYRLERDLENGRGRRGLGIQVFDSHTGKARPTSTLSGGETFISALALALGLADVVESASGKIRLDTIFIDEGFGSLDTENGSGTLDQVLQVLGTLVSQNRAVGIISHVPLVQEAIPNGFYVRKNVTGSTVETRGLT